MAEGTPLSPELGKTLARYLEIQQEERRLAEEKNRLRDVLAAHMDKMGRSLWFPIVAGQELKVRYNSVPQVLYNEELLRQRLGERYVRILAPDPKKLREHLAEIEPDLEPLLPLIGSPTPDKVRAAVEAGVVAKEEFRGAFEKSLKRILAVSRARREEYGDMPS
jgi:hypothetical protein